MKRPDLNNCKCIAVIGAGGKSTLATALCLALPGDNAFTTTTHSFFPNRLLAVQSPDKAALRALFPPRGPEEGPASGSHRTAAVLGNTLSVVNGRAKAGPPDEKTFAFLRARCDHLLIEADGAAGLLLKLHRPHEPAVPRYADVVLMVCSMRALGQPLSRCCHRPADVETRLGVSAESRCAEEDIVRCAYLGALGFPNAAVVLNAADDPRAAKRVAAALEQDGLPCFTVPAFEGVNEDELLAGVAEAMLSRVPPRQALFDR